MTMQANSVDHAVLEPVAVVNEGIGTMDGGGDFGNDSSDGNSGLEAVAEVFGPAAVMGIELLAAVVGSWPHMQ